jgi:pilus assembly protein Flp/PilA
MSQLIKRVSQVVGQEEEGASMVEYGLMVGLIAVVCIAAITTLGTTLNTMFTNINAAL